MDVSAGSGAGGAQDADAEAAADRHAALVAGLREVLSDRFGDSVRVEALTKLSSGASRQSFAFDAAPAGGAAPVPLILQRGSAAPGAEPALSMTAEASLLEAAGRGGVPVPEVVASGGPDSPLGAPFLVAIRMPGEALPTRLFRDERLAAGVARLTDDAAAALAAIHRLAPEGLGLVPNDLVAYYRQVLDFLAEARPALELTHRWLDANRPSARPPAVVHGDFRLGNLLVDATGLSSVLDWELAHLGDPLEDVAWPAIRAWRFDHVRPPGVFPDRGPWIAAYEAASGTAIDRDELTWWEIAGTFKWAVICLVQAYRHLTGMARSVELAAIGRRVCESEWDLLGLLASVGAVPYGALASRDEDEPPNDDAPPPVGLHGTTTAEILADAVRELLENKVLEATSGSLRHEVRVAAGALATVGRELRLGPAQEGDHVARLRALGFESDAGLAGAIRAGALDGREDVAAAIADDVRDRLLVANPGWRKG